MTDYLTLQGNLGKEGNIMGHLLKNQRCICQKKHTHISSCLSWNVSTSLKFCCHWLLIQLDSWTIFTFNSTKSRSQQENFEQVGTDVHLVVIKRFIQYIHVCLWVDRRWQVGFVLLPSVLLLICLFKPELIRWSYGFHLFVRMRVLVCTCWHSACDRWIQIGRHLSAMPVLSLWVWNDTVAFIWS